MNKLLLIIDVQNYFVPDGPEGENFCRKIEQLQDKYNFVAASKFINTPETFWVQYLEWNKMMEGEDSTNLAFKKAGKTFVYDNSTFTSFNDELLNYINKHNIEEVHICGVDTDACILATAYDLWDNKIHFQILIDHCISSAGENIHSSAQILMNKNFGFKIVKNAQ